MPWSTAGCRNRHRQDDSKEQEGMMEDKKEIRMTLAQLEMLMEYLPDGVVLEIVWEDMDGKES